MARRCVVTLIALAFAWAPRSAGGGAPAGPDATLTFTSFKGSPPQPQVVLICTGFEQVDPAVRYRRDVGWLRATISQSTATRSLIVQPMPFKLGPGVYRATIDLGEEGHHGARVDVALAVLASSHASCPRGSTLRYDGGGNGAGEPVDFGRTFFGTYCITCHASTKVGAARSGAPLGLDWDSLPGIRRESYAIDEAAARGPRASVAYMPPPNAPKHPTEVERELLGRWIACGAP